MNQPRWQGTKKIFGRATAIQHPSARRAYLEKACRGSPSLQAEVESLLAHQDDNLWDGHALRLGTRLLHYELVERLGEGSAGTVYKARDTRLGRFVALKVLPPPRAMDGASRRRLLREARCASALNHPNAVTIHDITYDKGVCFIVMEYVPGKTLHRTISGSGLPVQRCLDLAIQMAEALVKAHAAGIIHRDLKPSNILVSPEGQVKIVDFGLAKFVSPRRPIITDAEQTGKGIILGTASYMSPEQARGEKCDGRSDIFSFGVMLHEMLTGRRVFTRKSVIETMSAILTEDSPDLPPRVPDQVRRIVQRCLEKNPKRRFQMMRAVLAELNAARSSFFGSQPAVARRRSRRRRDALGT